MTPRSPAWPASRSVTARSLGVGQFDGGRLRRPSRGWRHIPISARRSGRAAMRCSPDDDQGPTIAARIADHFEAIGKDNVRAAEILDHCCEPSGARPNCWSTSTRHRTTHRGRPGLRGRAARPRAHLHRRAMGAGNISLAVGRVGPNNSPRPVRCRALVLDDILERDRRWQAMLAGRPPWTSTDVPGAMGGHCTRTWHRCRRYTKGGSMARADACPGRRVALADQQGRRATGASSCPTWMQRSGSSLAWSLVA